MAANTNLNINIKLPELWGTEVGFEKNDWGPINFLVGPNGAGKTKFAQQLMRSCGPLKPRFLSAERLAGLEATDQMGIGYFSRGFDLERTQINSIRRNAAQGGFAADAWLILRERFDIRIRVEATLSTLFYREIELIEEGGFLKPRMRVSGGGASYDFKQAECHGLKELISLLAFLYDDEFNCLIIDEPELHLHPQYQRFLLEQVRSVAGVPSVDPGAKIFFLVTHSPYILDFRSVDELRSCLVFMPGQIPRNIGNLEPEEERDLRRLLPRLNSHHKELFFAKHPIIVEGYRDEQLFTLIQEARRKNLGAHGGCIVGAGGKDECAVLFELCKQLGIECRVIADLDALLEGRLRQVLAKDEQALKRVQMSGLNPNVASAWGEMETHLNKLIDAALKESSVLPSDLIGAIQNEVQGSGHGSPRNRYPMLQAVRSTKAELESVLSGQHAEIDYVFGRSEALMTAFEDAGVYLLRNGALDNYLPSYNGSRFGKAGEQAKTTAFETEREWILCQPGEVETRYPEICELLDRLIETPRIDFNKAVAFHVQNFAHELQQAVRKGEFADLQALASSMPSRWPYHVQIMKITAFERKTSDGRFCCKGHAHLGRGRENLRFEFDDETVPANIRLST